MRKTEEKDERKLPKRPTYQAMITDAITTLNEKQGSSSVAIAKFIEEKYPVIETFRQRLKLVLKKGSDEGTFVKVRHSYKLNAKERQKISRELKKGKSPTKSRRKKSDSEMETGDADEQDSSPNRIEINNTTPQGKAEDIFPIGSESDEEYRKKVTARVKRRLFDSTQSQTTTS